MSDTANPAMYIYGWTNSEWAVAHKWMVSVFPKWEPGLVEVQRLWRHAHPQVSRPKTPPKYVIRFSYKDGAVGCQEVNQYELTTTGIKFVSLVTGDEIAYPLDVFDSVGVEERT